MENETLLTIAIPTYNGAKTIENLLGLLLPQCGPGVEVLVSDNASTDRTGEIVETYRNAYPFVRHVQNESNIGPDANFLQCMRLASGRFTWLVSDDDVLIEGAVEKVLRFLQAHPDLAFVYATTVDFRGSYAGLDACTSHPPVVEADLCTRDKRVFMRYAGAYWGFMSSFICSTRRFRKIQAPEQYIGTFWLQSYVHALCAAGDEALLGVVKGPCVGAGIYVNAANFDSALVNGVYYQRLLEFMADKAGFDKKQLQSLYRWRICHLSRHDILKEKAAGLRKLNRKTLFACTKRYPEAWLTVYPLLLAPGFACKFAMRLYRHKCKIKDEIAINRPE